MEIPTILEASTRDEMLDVLAALELSISPRHLRRDKNMVEWWIVKRMLVGLLRRGAFDEPLSLEHRDRPDFHLVHGSRHLGIEATEAGSASYNHATVVAGEEFPNAPIHSESFRVGAAPGSREEVRRHFQDPRPGYGMNRDAPEADWTRRMQETIDRKTRLLGSDGFRRFHQDWLVIYDNLPVPDPKRELAVQRLRCPAGFSTVIILTPDGGALRLSSLGQPCAPPSWDYFDCD